MFGFDECNRHGVTCPTWYLKFNLHILFLDTAWDPQVPEGDFVFECVFYYGGIRLHKFRMMIKQLAVVDKLPGPGPILNIGKDKRMGCVADSCLNNTSCLPNHLETRAATCVASLPTKLWLFNVTWWLSWKYQALEGQQAQILAASADTEAFDGRHELPELVRWNL